MRSVLILGAVWLLFCSLWASPCVTQVSPEGVWVGELRLENQRTFIRVNYRIEGGGNNATIEMPSSGLTRIELKRVSFQSPRAHFELDRSSGTLVFDGQLRNNEVSGEVRQGDARGTFQLLRSITIEPQLLTNLYGIYQVNPDRFIWVGKFGEFGADQFFFDSASGRFGPLYPSSETAFFSGQAIISPFFPVDVRITFTKNRNGAVTGLTYNQSGLLRVSARRIRLRQEEVNFRNGDVTLAGKLTTPLRRGSHPAVVLIHGSGPEDRDYLGPWIDFFATSRSIFS